MARWAVTVVLLLVPALGAMVAPACLGASAGADTGGSGSGGAGSGGSGSGGAGGSTSSGCDDGMSCADPCADVVCKAGEFCAYNGTCEPTPTCDGGADCAACTDRASCVKCNAAAFPSGWTAFVALSTCISCKACFTSCGGATVPGWMGGLLCPSAPSTTDACDEGACNPCETCATTPTGSCASALATCMSNADCTSLLAAIPDCPAPPPSDADAGDGG